MEVFKCLWFLLWGCNCFCICWRSFFMEENIWSYCHPLCGEMGGAFHRHFTIQSIQSGSITSKLRFIRSRIMPCQPKMENYTFVGFQTSKSDQVERAIPRTVRSCGTRRAMEKMQITDWRLLKSSFLAAPRRKKKTKARMEWRKSVVNQGRNIFGFFWGNI